MYDQFTISFCFLKQLNHIVKQNQSYMYFFSTHVETMVCKKGDCMEKSEKCGMPISLLSCHISCNGQMFFIILIR